jgi:hypothetical protein
VVPGCHYKYHTEDSLGRSPFDCRFLGSEQSSFSADRPARFCGRIRSTHSRGRVLETARYRGTRSAALHGDRWNNVLRDGVLGTNNDSFVIDHPWTIKTTILFCFTSTNRNHVSFSIQV